MPVLECIGNKCSDGSISNISCRSAVWEKTMKYLLYLERLWCVNIYGNNVILLLATIC